MAWYARLPELAQMVLSPDGKRIAGLLNDDDRTVLITREVQGEVVKTVMQSDNREFLFRGVRWLDDERLAVSVLYPARRGFALTNETRMFSVKTDGSGIVNLAVDRTAIGRDLGRRAQFQDRVIDWMSDTPGSLLLALGEPASAHPAVYRVAVDTGLRRLVKAPDRGVRDWISDAQHRVRIGVRQEGAHTEVIGSDPQGQAWRTLWQWDDPGAAVWPLGFGLDPQELYVRIRHEGRDAVYTVRLDQPELPRTLRLASPTRDIHGSLVRAPASGEVVGLRSGNVDEDGQSRSEFWDPAWRELMRGIDRQLPGRDNRLVNLSRDQQRYLVYSSSDRQPGQFFLGDRREAALTLMGQTYPELTPARLAGLRPVRIERPDGRPVEARLAQAAPGATGTAPGPLVIFPQPRGPGRGGIDFDLLGEYMASRGYAVLEVDFNATDGLQHWAPALQEDLGVALRWAVAQRIADPARVCIVGTGEAGYAALMALVLTPERFHCGVSYAGITDLQEQVRFMENYVGGTVAARRAIGDFWSDRERLRATSPALLAEQVRAPVLLVHGTADRVVPVQQSQDMARALARAGKPYLYVEQEGGDHALSRQAQRLQFFQALQDFLDAQLTAAH